MKFLTPWLRRKLYIICPWVLSLWRILRCCFGNLIGKLCPSCWSQCATIILVMPVVILLIIHSSRYEQQIPHKRYLIFCQWGSSAKINNFTALIRVCNLSYPLDKNGDYCYVWHLHRNITKISRFRGCPTLWNKNGVSFLTLNFLRALSFEKIAKIVCPSYATISLVPDSEVINPSVMRTTIVVLRNSIINC